MAINFPRHNPSEAKRNSIISYLVIDYELLAIKPQNTQLQLLGSKVRGSKPIQLGIQSTDKIKTKIKTLEKKDAKFNPTIQSS